MSPLAFHRKESTPVRLNPPFLTYVTQISDPGPVSYGGSATLTGVATVNYLVSGIGTLGYEWRINNSVVGVGTQLTLTNMTDTAYNDKQVIQYVTFYPDATRVGIETFQPGATNSPLTSNTVTLKVKGVIIITQQPDGTVPVDTNATTNSSTPVVPTPSPTPTPTPRPTPTPAPPPPAPLPNCNPLNANYNLLNVRNANLNTTYTQTFTLNDVDNGCTGFTVKVDGPTASLIVGGVSGNNLPAQKGSVITVRMKSSPEYDRGVSTGFYITRNGSNSVAQSWFIITKEA